MNRISHLFATVLALVLPWLGAAGALAADLDNRPVAEVRIEGLDQVPERLVRNAIRIAPGDPFDQDVVDEDITRITYLGRFSSVLPRITQQADGSLIITYTVVELPLLSDVQVVGNKTVPDLELLGIIGLRAGDPLDRFLIDRAIQEIKRRYEQEGYFVADASVDEPLLAESGILIFRIREGPKVKIRSVRFEGNAVYNDKELKSKIRSSAAFLFFKKGTLSREQLDADAAAIRAFYHDTGYLDARVARRIDLSPDQQDAIVTFIIEEGAQYLVSGIRVEGNLVYATAQILEMIDLKVGDVYSKRGADRSRQALIELYGKLGHIETRVSVDSVFHDDQPRVEVVVTIVEGEAYRTGIVTIRGNTKTKDNVVLRQLRGMRPGRTMDRAGIETTERRLRNSPLFSDAKVTILDPEEDQDPQRQLERDVLVEVAEGNTGSIGFGAGISSDAGIVGAIDVVQRNFDIADLPESWGELFTGKAFTGAGQYLAIAIQPGNEVSNYSMTFREPYIFETDYFFEVRGFFFQRQRQDYDEERFGGAMRVGQRFGDVWSGSIKMRFENIDIDDIDMTAPVDVFAVAGANALTSIGIALTRDTTDSSLFPTRGSRLSMELARIGGLGGDFDYNEVSASFYKFWPIEEDFFGRVTVLSLRMQAGYLFGGSTPTFERNYAGGHRSFRGFDYRGVGPRGIIAGGPKAGMRGDDPVGGDWMFLVGVEYNFPIYQEILRGVFFTDTGTVQEDVGFDDYRVSVGAGIRLKVPFLGQAPFAFDFAVPIVKEKDDETRIFSFDVALPF